VPILPLAGMTEALHKGEVDAVAIWEPEGVNSEAALGADAIVFDGDGVYAELFNLNTTAAALADPAKRAQIVRFVRAIIDATAEIEAFPDEAQRLSAEAGSFSPEDVRESWEHHRFNAKPLDHTLEVMVLQEQWLSPRENREPRSREQLATLIDTSVYAEALALEAGE
jgi:sulfonate transport system substrate-binding protein